MSLKRYAAKRDTNEAEIVSALERIGVTVFRISGSGIPDLLTFYRGQWLPLEVKLPKGKLTEPQAATFLRAPFALARTVEEALACFTKPRGGAAKRSRPASTSRQDRTVLGPIVILPSVPQR